MTDLQKYTQQFELTKEDIKTLEQAGVIPKGTPASQVDLFGRQCAEYKLSPFKRQIHLVKRKQKNGESWTDIYSAQTGIDGFRAIAERTGRYAGSDDYTFDEGLNQYQMIESKRLKPKTATAIVHKLLPNGQVMPIKATVRWEEYFPGDKQGFMWNKMPFLMLGKCAEALALRKSFPEDLGGLYIFEEMAQTEKPVKEPKPETTNPQAFEEISFNVKEFQDAKELSSKAEGIILDAKQRGCSDSEVESLKQIIKDKHSKLREK